MKFIYPGVSLEHLNGLDPKTVTFLFDFGKVISNFLDGRTVEQARTNNVYLDTPPYQDAFRVIGKAVEAFKCVGMISRCGPIVQGMVETWLRHHHVHEETGLDPRNQHFTYTCEAKAVTIRKVFGTATYFLDDGLQVLNPMVDVTEHRLLYGPQEPSLAVPPGIVRLHNWLEVEHYIGLA